MKQVTLQSVMTLINEIVQLWYRNIEKDNILGGLALRCCLLFLLGGATLLQAVTATFWLSVVL